MVYGLRGGGWTHQYASLIGSAQAHGEAAGVFTVGLSVAALSAFMNNLPATRQGGKLGSQSGIEPLDEGSVDGTPLALSLLDEAQCLKQVTEGQAA